MPIVTCALLGKLISGLFGITLPAFRIMGGILVVLIGYQMLHGQQSAVHQDIPEDQQGSLEAALSIAVTPLAVPIFADPEPSQLPTLASRMSHPDEEPCH